MWFSKLPDPVSVPFTVPSNSSRWFFPQPSVASSRSCRHRALMTTQAASFSFRVLCLANSGLLCLFDSLLPVSSTQGFRPLDSAKLPPVPKNGQLSSLSKLGESWSSFLFPVFQGITHCPWLPQSTVLETVVLHILPVLFLSLWL